MCSDCFHMNKYVWVYADVTVLNIDREEEDEYEVEHFPLQYEHFCQPKRRKNPFGFLRAAQFFQAQKLTAIIRKGKTDDLSTLSKKEKLLRAATSALSKGVKKRCNCGKYCHKTCIGKCSDV